MHYRIFFFFFFFLASSIFAGAVDQARQLANEVEYDQAIPLLEKHLSQMPDDLDALRLLAKIYAWNTNYDKAIGIYDQLLKHSPGNINYIFEKAKALLWLNKNEQALPLLEKVWQKQPDNSEAWRLLILTLDHSESNQNKIRAKELLERAKKKFPNVHWEFM